MNELIRIHPDDMVAVALQPLAAGTALEVEGIPVTLTEDTPMGHKVALRAIRCGEPVIKYGEEIGRVKADTPRGKWIHTHNMSCERGTR